MLKIDLWDAEDYQWESTPHPHICICKDTGKYHFLYETGVFDSDGFGNVVHCEEALCRYNDWLNHSYGG